MSAPELTRPLVLEQASQLADGAGGYDKVWSSLGTLWADVRLRGGHDVTGQGGSLGRAALRITVRAAPQGAPSRPLPGQRFRDAARIYAIHAVGETDADGRFLVCVCEEELSI